MKLGIDIVDLDRFRKKVSKNPSLERRLFTQAEVEYCRSFSDPIPHLAGTFAAKEAVIKTLGRNPGWKAIEIRREGGRPVAYLHGRALRGSLSISHSRLSAVAAFLLEEVV